MAVLHEAQQTYITQLEEARVVYDKFEEDLKKEIEQRKWDAKERIRTLVQEARDLNVPMRQIGIALKTSDYATLKNYQENVRKKK